ncbi:MAG: hypothetical protein COB35_01990 [Gammaproteobacteria bacterium]|nr:MAG: hypothetical protein COB35_01990 [Gammaproteobacteria bacterium]
MPEQLSEDLAQFKTIILSLISYAMHPKLDTLIDKLTPAEKPSVRFLIKVEIKRLSKPCPYVLDFRTYFENCEPLQFQNICHYLDEISKTLFLASIEQNNGLFSINIYNEINNQAKQRHLEAKQQENIHRQNSQIQIEPVKAFNLINSNICRDQPLNAFSKCKVFTYDPLGMSRKGKDEIGLSVSILDLNPHNCVIRAPLETIDYQTKIVYLWFYDHDRKLDYYQDVVLQYTVEDFKEVQGNTNTHYRLKLNKVSDSKMIGHLADLLNKINLVVNELRQNQVQPLVDSIYAKSHEQFLLTNTHDIAMVCAPYKTGWRPSGGLQTKSNQALWDFFSAQGNNDPLTRLFCNDTIQTAFNQQQTFDQYAYVLRHSYQKDDQQSEKTQFIVMWQAQLENNTAAEKFLAKHILNGNYRYIRLRMQPIDALSDAYNPSAVPSHVNPAMALLNRTLGKQVTNILKASNYSVILSDVSEINSVLALSKCLGVKEKLQSTDSEIKCPNKFKLPALQRKSPLEVVRVEENDFRAEDRFDAKINVTITRCGTAACDIKAVTNNISTKGLALKLNKTLQYKAGVELKLTLEIPYKGKIVTLPNQVYQLIGGHDQKNLRLVISTSESRHAASWMLREYIYQNMDTLQPTGFSGQQTYGLERALRNIYARNHTNVPFFIHQDKRQWYIDSVALNENSVIQSLALGDVVADEMLINLIQQEKFRNYCLSVINKVDKKNPVEVFYILTLPRNSKGNTKQAFWFNDLKQLQQAGRLLEVVEKIRVLGTPTILRVQLSKPHRIMDKYFRDELQYLSQISGRKAEELVTSMEHVSGIGEITDATEQMLALIDTYIAVKEPVKLANVG